MPKLMSKGAGQKNGYTALPNHLFDELLYGKRNCVDAFLLASHLCRHLLGQSGTIRMEEQFSREQMCTDLKWGTTNRRRFNKALDHLVDLGIVNKTLTANSVYILKFSAELPKVADSAKLAENTPTQTSQIQPENEPICHTPLVENVIPPYEDLSHPPMRICHTPLVENVIPPYEDLSYPNPVIPINISELKPPKKLKKI